MKRKRDMKATNAANGNNSDGIAESLIVEAPSRFYSSLKGYKIPGFVLFVAGLAPFIVLVVLISHLSSTNDSGDLVGDQSSTSDSASISNSKNILGSNLQTDSFVSTSSTNVSSESSSTANSANLLEANASPTQTISNTAKFVPLTSASISITPTTQSSTSTHFTTTSTSSPTPSASSTIVSSPGPNSDLSVNIDKNNSGQNNSFSSTELNSDSFDSRQVQNVGVN